MQKKIEKYLFNKRKNDFSYTLNVNIFVFSIQIICQVLDITSGGISF